MTGAIEHVEGSGFFLHDESGRRIAELTYRRTGTATVLADHTWVDPSLRGRGVAKRLLDALVAWARATGTKIIPVCSYVVAEARRDPGLGDVMQ
jgi:hypothetical protein